MARRRPPAESGNGTSRRAPALAIRNHTVRTFVLVWLGQAISAVGSQLTAFGLAVWLYQRTGSATLQGFALAIASISFGAAAPLAGVVVDRWDRRLAMIAGHAGAGACSLVIAVLYGMRALDPWAILALVGAASFCNAVQLPAFAAAMTTLVPPERLGRANGLAQLGISVTQVVAPGAAGLLLPAIGLGGVLLIDAATFLAAIAILSAIAVPRPAPAAAIAPAAAPPLADATLGWRYIRRRPDLLRLLGLLVAVNFVLGALEVLVVPLVLGFADARILGVVLAAGGAGMVAGSALMAAWGGPCRPLRGILAAMLLQGICVCLVALRPSVPLVAAGVLGTFFAIPLVTALNQLHWQRSVPPDLQGRVFSFRFVLAGASLPLAFAVAGPLADGVFEPLMREGGPLAASLGRVLGAGPGRGAALLLLVLGTMLLGLAAMGSVLQRAPGTVERIPAPAARNAGA
jgi:MFS family permease